MHRIWKFEEGLNKVYLEESELKEHILRLQDARIHCKYYRKGRLEGWDLIYPEALDSEVNKILKGKKE